MSTLPAVLVTLAGLAMIGLALRDIFDVLRLHGLDSVDAGEAHGEPQTI